MEMQTHERPLCKDCRWFQPRRFCSRPEGSTSLVTGKPIRLLVLAEDERSPLTSMHCGIMGKYWQPRIRVVDWLVYYLRTFIG